jgi:hypothetical protein
MTTRDWVHIVLTAMVVYPPMVALLFLVRLFFLEIEPFRDAVVVGLRPFVGVEIGQHWLQNRATGRKARLAQGVPATMRGSFQGREGIALHSVTGQGCLDLTGDALRFRPLHFPRTPSPSFPLDSLEVLEVGHHQGCESGS